MKTTKSIPKYLYICRERERENLRTQKDNSLTEKHVGGVELFESGKPWGSGGCRKIVWRNEPIGRQGLSGGVNNGQRFGSSGFG